MIENIITDIIDQDKVREYVHNFYSKDYGNERGIWHIYCWQKWAHKHYLS